MISVLVYGRNDSYGYNLHKRAAISINAICELLADEDDEFIFVDYNTPDDFPTFPEAIQDTLTEQARRRLRILRARPFVHRAVANERSMPLIEPLCRNIAALRSNPSNRWLLSTNTDIILHMRRQESLGAMLASLEPGFYQAPRIEVPESLWEGFDRSNPAAVTAAIARLAPALHLDEIVLGSDKIMYDGPGDFQLMERKALFAIDGFDERMDRGWHVDANLAVRMALHYGALTGLEDRIFAYHCDHTRQTTPAHKADRQENDPAIYVNDLASPSLPDQRGKWGAPDFAIEEIRLPSDGGNLAYVGALSSAVGAPQSEPGRAVYGPSSYDQVSYDPRHVIPFLIDLISSAPSNLRLGWVGFREETLSRFLLALRALGLTQPVRVLERLPEGADGACVCTRDEWLRECDLFVLDFGDEINGKPLSRARRGTLGWALHALKQAENERQRNKRELRRIVGINVVHNRYERAFAAAVAAAATPFSTRIRHGFARPRGQRTNWLGLTRTSAKVIGGATRGLATGRHDLELRLGESATGDFTLAVKVDDSPMLDWRGNSALIGTAPVSWCFFVPSDGQTVSVELAGLASGDVLGLASKPWDSDDTDNDLAEEMLGFDRDWLPYCLAGAAGTQTDEGVKASAGDKGHVIYGPYWNLPPGSYRATIYIDGSDTDWARALTTLRPPISFEARTSSGERLGWKIIIPRKRNQAVTMLFSVKNWHIGFPLELRIRSSGASEFTIRRLSVERV